MNARKKKAKSNQNERTTKTVKPEDYELNKVLLDAVDIAIKRKQQKLQSVQNKLGKIRADEVIKWIVYCYCRDPMIQSYKKKHFRKHLVIQDLFINPIFSFLF